MLYTAEILKYYKGSTPWACNSNRSMGVSQCKPVNGQILSIHTHTKRGCGFHNLTDTKLRLKSRCGSRRTYVGIAAPPCREFLNFASHVIQSRSDPDNFKLGLTWMTQKKMWPGRPDPISMLIIMQRMDQRLLKHAFVLFMNCQLHVNVLFWYKRHAQWTFVHLSCGKTNGRTPYQVLRNWQMWSEFGQ